MTPIRFYVLIVLNFNRIRMRVRLTRFLESYKSKIGDGRVEHMIIKGV